MEQEIKSGKEYWQNLLNEAQAKVDSGDFSALIPVPSSWEMTLEEAWEEFMNGEKK